MEAPRSKKLNVHIVPIKSSCWYSFNRRGEEVVERNIMLDSSIDADEANATDLRVPNSNGEFEEVLQTDGVLQEMNASYEFVEPTSRSAFSDPIERSIEDSCFTKEDTRRADGPKSWSRYYSKLDRLLNPFSLIFPDRVVTLSSDNNAESERHVEKGCQRCSLLRGKMSIVRRDLLGVKYINQSSRHVMIRLHEDLVSEVCNVVTTIVDRLMTQRDEAEREASLLRSDNMSLQVKVGQIQQKLSKCISSSESSYQEVLRNPCGLENIAQQLFSSVLAFTTLCSKYQFPGGLRLAKNRKKALKICSFNLRTDIRLETSDHISHVLQASLTEQLFRAFETERFSPLDPSVLFFSPEERVETCRKYLAQRNIKRSNDYLVIPVMKDNVKIRHRLFPSYHAYMQTASVAIFGYNAFADVIPPTVEGNFRDTCFADEIVEGNKYLNKVLQSFVAVASDIWDFHKFCLTFDPPATIYRLAGGTPFDPIYMDTMDPLGPLNDTECIRTVGFTIKPGFRHGKSLIKPCVYLYVPPGNDYNIIS